MPGRAVKKEMSIETEAREGINGKRTSQKSFVMEVLDLMPGGVDGTMRVHCRQWILSLCILMWTSRSLLMGAGRSSRRGQEA